MTKHDWDNLQFLLNATPETLCDWYDKMEEDDHEYASDLLALYGEELEVKSALIKDPEIKDFGEAADILARYRK
jgi:hypothetical protein